MDYQNISNTFLLQVFIFMTWSAVLYGLALAITKILPQLVKWSRFWQAWLLISVVPLLPSYFYQVKFLIPNGLKEVLSDSQHNLLNHSNLVVSQIESIEVLQALLWLALALIVTGCCLSVLRFLSGLLKVNRFVKQSIPLIDFEHFTLKQKAIITANNISIRITNQPVSPFVFGFFKVNMLLPSSVFDMSQQQRFLLIEHELMHIKRKDPKAVIIFRFCSSIFWFNPFIRFIEKQFLQNMELNCDAAVISSYPKAKLDYVKALVTSIKLSKNTIDSELTTYFSGPQLTKQDFESRMKLAMSTQNNQKYGTSYRIALAMLTFSISCIAIAGKPFFSKDMLNVSNQNGVQPVLNGYISSDYNDVNTFRGNKQHKAIDFAAQKGTKVVASFSGKVLVADDTTFHSNYGKVVLIEHEDQIQSLYAHLDSFFVKSGQYISAGEKLGTVGETGRATGPHLHFEILDKGERTNPKFYLNLKNKKNIR